MDNKVSVLIIEDESIVALGLEDTLKSEGYHVSDIADNGREALRIIKKEDTDLMLLDIQIKSEWDGIETARQLTAVKDIPFIYLTGFSDNETVERAMETIPAAYLVKPYQPQNLLIAIDLALHNFAFRKAPPTEEITLNPEEHSGTKDQKDAMLSFNDSIFINQNYMFYKVNLNDICFLEAKGNYTTIVTEERKYVLRHTLNTILEKLKFQALLRIPRSYAINLQHIDTFNDISVFINGNEIPLSRHYKEEFLHRFDLL